LANRLDAASEELRQIERYDYVVINDDVERACDRIQAIIMAEHCRKDRLILSD
jgi:guanylate kinase